MKEKPEIIPLLLLKGRTALFREYSKKELSAFSKDLRKRDFEKLYILDVDGIELNRPQLDIVQALSDDFTISYDAGPRKGANVVDLVIAGADMIYMGTYALEGLDEIEIALSYTENVGLKIDWNKGVLGHGYQIEGSQLAEIISNAIDYGAKDIVVPVEIIDDVSEPMYGKEVALRAIADRPGDEKIFDSRIASLIVNHELLQQEGSGQ